MRREYIAITVAITLAGCATSEPANPVLAPIYDEFIAEVAEDGPENFFDFFTLASFRSDGDTLIGDLMLGAEGQAAYDADPAELQQDLWETFFYDDPCSDSFMGPILTNGGTIRYDVTSDTGRPLFSFQSPTCKE